MRVGPKDRTHDGEFLELPLDSPFSAPAVTLKCQLMVSPEVAGSLTMGSLRNSSFSYFVVAPHGALPAT